MNKDKMLEELSVLQERFANGMGWRDGEYEEALDEAIELINKMSSADVVEVVRCKDCKYNYGIAHNCEFAKSDIVCTLWESDGFDESDYCSRGERKETDA